MKKIFIAFISTFALLLTACGEQDQIQMILFEDEVFSETEKRALGSCIEIETSKLEVVENQNSNVHFSAKVTNDGYDIFAPLDDGGIFGYRYGPSIIYNEDGSIDAWFASNAEALFWDVIAYKHSDDGGKTWSAEKVVHWPAADSMDSFSNCDPVVVYFGGYYYLGYTSTICDRGTTNNVHVSRSKNPDGPFEPWNGSGWGGNPMPIIYYDENIRFFGAGEPSFVVVEDTLYIYYDYLCQHGSYTRVALADATNENWPETMKFAGTCYKNGGGQDSADVVYVEEYGKFLAFSTFERMGATSGVRILESDDGINFTVVQDMREGISQYCHNMGISKKPNGHVSINDDLFIGYGYGEGWGVWNTRFQGIELSTYEGDINYVIEEENVYREALPLPLEEAVERIFVTSDPFYTEIRVGETQKVDIILENEDPKKDIIADLSEVKIYGYDEEIIEIDGFNVTGKKVGETVVNIEYKGMLLKHKVFVRSESFIMNDDSPILTAFYAVDEDVTVYLDDVHEKQIRLRVEFDNGTWGEAFRTLYYKGNDSYYAYEDLIFTVEDESVISVNEDGFITPKKAGTTTVTATTDGGFRKAHVKITVIDPNLN